MSDNQSNLTDKEMEDLQSIVADTLANVCAMADKHNIDRDSMLKYFADMLTSLAEFASIQNYETKKTNADRIRNMSDEELASWYVIKCEIMMGIKCQKPYKTCKDCILQWLQSEAE